ncbi:hypothetical protein A3H65_01870 [Candidatus Giovannonibacteria bacterium RIFCSPLOWO2_02_FULL_45_14]|uniref:Uncharacterized protein n=1 Tax=Candidatus Giovannonibacteria bacterium RIFCSPLOWO2_12_FULL_44_15 TaxID=1798364 RepID=A0A1F5Y0G6_9BACT|nr:MAG: hypothetical protein A3C75_03985 [Candidatus Giovannonibacteria bacterium RIFCSPHIGHO2_02_FULL_44_31]OGF77122.1 MAG: hypothetical protein A3E62_03700 [Candidatus Giovannonibacteria bacterium RIFCSPHIGHO2_12_FULL_44_29]OGF91198.1 MAG: hypothetical protein A3H65_01870 [Candidatus Giovannonibacteria bacterium RIFCSPLOWO2_02_FULL_45_14]OGF93351.1 MAG: hypothetical protein A3G54_00420 [Candidatus Giovannonibacteria bacterium RIFCSPLOWO2_12_FULL_44_15]
MKFTHNHATVFFWIGLLGLALFSALAYKYYFPSEPLQRACTEEAKICPDGSYVGRIGPNCEFAACPDLKTETLSLYSSLDWKRAENVEWSEIGDYKLIGYKVSAEGSAVIDAYNNDFREYYNVLLARNGWSENLKIAADGPDGGIWGYIKNGKHIIFEYSRSVKTISIFWNDANMIFKNQLDTSTWKTYRNERFAYEIKFPSDSILTEEDPNLGEASIKIVKELGANAPNISIKNWPVFLSVCQDCGGGGLGIDNIKIEEPVNLGGRLYKASGYFYYGEKDSHKILSIDFGNFQLFYGFRSEYKKPFSQQEIDKYDKLTKQILSTFKFLK